MTAREAPDEIPAGDRHAEGADADGEARPAAAKELAEPTSRKLRAVAEEFVDGFAELRRFIRQAGRAIKVDSETEGNARGSLFGPIGDEFLGVWIEVSFANGEGSMALNNCLSSETWTSISSQFAGS